MTPNINMTSIGGETISRLFALDRTVLMGSYTCIGWLSLDLANIKFGLIIPNRAILVEKRKVKKSGHANTKRMQK